VVAKWQDLFCVIDAVGLCVFFSVRYLVEQDLMVKPLGITELLNGATGAGYAPEEVERAGERIFNAERLYLIGAGFRRRDDALPPRITEEPMPAGPAKGLVCRLQDMLDPYYRLRGWNTEGVPQAAKLRELGLL
jgi:aldehyde:ferredoxin oxidoreductase